jgi:NAD(P)-dependent dehydrogenase (short-subunit alcohol dehydrogenase family)
MNLGLEGRVAVVAGASQGLGRAAALSLAAERVRLVLVARTADKLEAVASDARAAGAAAALVVPQDLTADNAGEKVAAAAVDAFGTVDRLVNVLGGPEYDVEFTGFLSMDDAAWRRAFETVTLAVVRLCRAVLPVMLDAGSGAIVNVAGGAVRQHIPSMGQHESQKAAIAHVTKSLAREFAPAVRVNAVLPGMIGDERNRARLDAAIVETGMTEAEIIRSMTHDYYELTWSGRAGRPEEFADAITFLLSDRASYVNGAWLNIDGGTSPG